MTCKKCGSPLKGKQTSYCSLVCSKIHLRSCYRKRSTDKIRAYNRKWKVERAEVYKLQKMRYAQRKRLKAIELGKAILGIQLCTLRKSLVYIMRCQECGETFETPRKRQFCELHRGRAHFTKLRFEVLKRDNFTCRYCGRSAPEVKLHVDHIMPRSKGGIEDMSNLVTACFDCNVGKGATPLDSLLETHSPIARVGAKI